MGTKAVVVTGLLPVAVVRGGCRILEENQTNSFLLYQSREASEESGETWMLEVAGGEKDEVAEVERQCSHTGTSVTG